MNRDRYLLYFDDTGSRRLAKLDAGGEVPPHTMDWFALGGILVKEEEIEELIEKHKEFCSAWQIDYPLHSSRIRGHHGKFGWLDDKEKRNAFLPALEGFLLSLPFVGIACVIDRPGYSSRYRDVYHNNLWPMSKTTFSILVERSAKFADSAGRDLRIFFEQCGKKEDRRIIQYLKDLKKLGNPFDLEISGDYAPLAKEDYLRIVVGEPRRLTKKASLIQVADLVLYPMTKGGYDGCYYPYRKLKEAGKLIDCLLPENEVSVKGIKYSCFGG